MIASLVIRIQKLSLAPALLVLAIYGVVGLVFEPAFIGVPNLTSMLSTVAGLLPAVVGMQLLLILGRFDLSVGAVAALSGMVAGVTFNHTGSLALGLSACLLTGATIGFLSGAIVARFRVDPLVTTLAMMGIGRSLALVVNGNEIVTGLPSSLGWLANARSGDIPILVVLGLFLAAAASAATQHLVVFRRFYAVGSNERAAANAGINASTALILGFVIAGIGGAATGMIQVSRTLSASPLTFQTLPIDLITACILGGATLSGGRGGIIGATIGMTAVVATANLVVILGVLNEWKDFATGALLLVVVTWRPVLQEIKTTWHTIKLYSNFGR